MNKKPTFIEYTALILLIIGGLNWFFSGVLNFNLVDKLADGLKFHALAIIIYVLVGLSVIPAIIYLSRTH